MAIFAKKKDGRREREKTGQATAEPGEREPGESEALEPSGETETVAAAAADLATNSADAAAPKGTTDAEAKAADTKAADVGAARREPAAAKPAPGAAGGASKDGVSAAAPEPIEPVDIEPEEVPPLPVFGIADAIRLMRSLPADPNVELVVRVVRVTLGALSVSVDDILQDAERKEQRVQDSIAVLEGEVGELETQLQAKRAAIAAHQADLRETATVRERLRLADRYTPHPPPLPPDAARVHLPKPREWESFDSDTPFGDTPFKES